MIIDKKIKVKINKRNIEHYSLFYKGIELKDIIEVDPNNLQKSSNLKVNVSCDICGVYRNIKYQAYTKNINSCEEYKIYTCDKCSHVKIKSSNRKKWGVDYFSQTDEYNDKFKSTMLERYGVEYSQQSTELKEKTKRTNLEKFGYENPFMDSDRIKLIFNEKYGVNHPSQVKEFNDKIKETNLERYGYKSVLSSPIIRDKIKKTNIIKYGYISPMKNYLVLNKLFNTCMFKYGSKTYMGTDDFNEKSKKTILNKYGVVNIMKSNEIRKDFIISLDINYIKYLDDSISLFNCDKELDHTFEMTSDNYHNRTRSNISLCTVCNPIGENRSVKEKELLEYIKSIYLDEVICSYRDGLEIDIYLPKLKIGFEFNGLYWHSDEYKERNYHLDKTNYFKDKLIKVIHIWEDDWVFKKEIIKSQLKNLLNLSCKIFARKCNVREVSTKESREFLENNHIQGKVNSSLKLGLYYNEYLVSLMTFDYFEGRKKMEDSGWNLNRFCNRTGISVVGGASKLLKYFTNNYNVKRIISYADKDWSVGDLYYKLGFSDIGGNGPDYKYIVDGKRVHKSRYKKSKLKTKLTESKQMELNGIKRIYDCGKIKFEKLF